jgi:hypothetical protein
LSAVLLLGVIALALASFGRWWGSAQAALYLPTETTWSSAVPVAQTATDSRNPSSAQAPDGTRYVVWEEGVNVYESDNSGTGWSQAGLVASGEAPVVVISGTTPVVIFENEIAGNREIYAVKREGAAWSLPRNVSSTDGGSFAADAAVGPDGKIYVVWTDNTSGSNALYLASSSDAVNWAGGPLLINGSPVAGSAPALAVDPGGTLHVVWQNRDIETGKLEVFYTRGSGTTWSLAENLSSSSSVNSAFPNVVADAGGIAYVTWEEGLSGGSEVYFTSGRPGNWTVPQSVSGAGPSVLPSLDRDALGGLHVAWSRGSPATAIQYSEWLTTGVGWSTPVTVTTHTAGLGDVRLLAGTGGTIYVNWAQASSETNWDIYDASQTPQSQWQVFLPTIRR